MVARTPESFCRKVSQCVAISLAPEGPECRVVNAAVEVAADDCRRTEPLEDRFDGSAQIRVRGLVQMDAGVSLTFHNHRQGNAVHSCALPSSRFVGVRCEPTDRRVVRSPRSTLAYCDRQSFTPHVAGSAAGCDDLMVGEPATKKTKLTASNFLEHDDVGVECTNDRLAGSSAKPPRVHSIETSAGPYVERGYAQHLVGLAGFEPTTSCPPDKRANQAAPQPE